MITKTQLQRLRSGYRFQRRRDQAWRPDPYATRNAPRYPPNHAERYLAALTPRLREAVAADPVPAAARRSPRATWYRMWAPPYGRFARLDLAGRVALRQALLQLQPPELRGLARITMDLEAQALRSQAERAAREQGVAW
jgi:hypothetical protein